MYNYVSKQKHTKEGVLNEELALKKLLTYMKSVYKIPQKIKGLTDKRQRKSIPLFNIVMPTLIFLMLQYDSFHTVFSAPECMSKRLKNCIQGRIPKVDAVRDLLSRIDPGEIYRIHEETIDTMKRNRVFREGTIGGYVVAGIDGVELFSSTKKACPECLNRKTQSGQTEWFHRSVVCMTVGKAPHVILGQEMLKPKDGSGKDEGGADGRKAPDRTAEEETWTFRGCDRGRCIISKCALYQHTQRERTGRGNPFKGRETDSVPGCGRLV